MSSIFDDVDLDTRVDTILDEKYVENLSALSFPELRERRNNAIREEAELSYVRRLIHGRVDLLESKIIKKDYDTQSEILSDEELVTKVTHILLDAGNPIYKNSPRHMGYQICDSDNCEQAERTLFDIRFLKEEDEEELKLYIIELKEWERNVSAKRTKLHAVIDVLTLELSNRYKSGILDWDQISAS